MKLIPFLLKTVIAPHGITDIGHSIYEDNQDKLLKIYGINLTCCNIFMNQLNNNHLIDIILIISSIIHFRHDFPAINYGNKLIPKYFFSMFIIFTSIFINNDYLVYYMTLLHVPNHFRLNNFHIKELKILNYSFFILLGLLFLYIDENYHYILENDFILTNMKSIIVSHVIYQETYILNKNEKNWF